MQVLFYSFSKKDNSTSRPSRDGTAFDCVLKSESSIVNPVIQLNIGTLENPSAFNYCYIAVYKRYYYVSEWTWTAGRLWQASLSVDVLASWKDEIGSQNLYILRSAALYDGNIIDSMYPTSGACTFVQNSTVNPFNPRTDSNAILPKYGSFIIGVTADDAQFGSVNYYVMNIDNLKVLCAYLLSSIVTDGNGFSADDATLALQKSLVDPMQYIKSCTWIPILYSSFTDAGYIEYMNPKVYTYTITDCYYYKLGLGDNAMYRSNGITLAIPKHPQTAERGNFVNMSPFTVMSVYVPGFGHIQLDTTITANADTLQGYILLDYITGKGTLRLHCGDHYFSYCTSQIGVPIQLSQVTQDILGTGQSIVSGIQNAFNMNFSGAVDSIVSATKSAMPQSTTIGSNGGYSDLHGKPTIYAQFFQIVADDNDHHGRPLCINAYPRDYYGYQLILDGDLKLPATQSEISAVRSFLEGGYFYE